MGGREEGVPGADEFIVGADILGRASLLAEGMRMTGKLALGVRLYCVLAAVHRWQILCLP